MKASKFMDLTVWKKAHRFVLAVYRFSKTFPQEEIYCLTRQLREAAISVPANIAEGFRRRTKNEKLHFLSISHGSLEECKYYLTLAHDLGYGSSNATELAEEVSKLLDASRKSLLTINH